MRIKHDRKRTDKVNKELESLRTVSTRLETDLYATKKEGELANSRQKVAIDGVLEEIAILKRKNREFTPKIQELDSIL